MPSNELKQRKKTSQKQPDEAGDVAKPNGETETKKVDEQKLYPQAKSSSRFPEVRTILCLLCVSACVALTWLVIQQNERLAEVEKNYSLLHSRTATYSELEQRVERVSEKLDASRSRLQGALSSIPTATRLLSEVASLRSVVTAIQASEGDGDSSDVTSSSIQEVNARFLNVTEAWQSGLAAVTSDLTALREESRASHVRATDGVNESERRLRALTERLEELQDSTRRNARVFERTEEDDVQQARRQLDWTSERVAHVDGAVTQLQRRDRELAERLEEQEARQQECQEHLPAVEEAVRSILRLTTGLQALERRAEELGGEVMGLEDSMLRGLTQTLDIKQRVDTLCTSLLSSMSELDRQAPVLSNMASVEQEVGRLAAWSSGAQETRRAAQEKATALGRAVDAIQERTSTITRDMGAKVAAVRTDVRRMGGLESDVTSLLERATELEEKLEATERAMVKRMAELLASSIDRVSDLKSTTNANAQRLDTFKQPIAELQAADAQLWERIAALESGRARLMRTVTFAGDLKPKVYTIQRDFGAVEPRLDDLTLRIGHLAGDVMRSERDVTELRDKLDTLTGGLDAQSDLTLSPLTETLTDSDADGNITHTHPIDTHTDSDANGNITHTHPIDTHTDSDANGNITHTHSIDTHTDSDANGNITHTHPIDTHTGGDATGNATELRELMGTVTGDGTKEDVTDLRDNTDTATVTDDDAKGDVTELSHNMDTAATGSDNMDTAVTGGDIQGDRLDTATGVDSMKDNMDTATGDGDTKGMEN